MILIQVRKVKVLGVMLSALKNPDLATINRIRPEYKKGSKNSVTTMPVSGRCCKIIIMTYT
jgi:hypothetical protein